MAKKPAAAPSGPANQGPVPQARLQAIYREKIVPDLMAKFGFTSVMQVPRLTKITLNMGVSEAVSDKKVMDHAVSDLTKIAGQKPVVTKSKKPIAGFKIREGQAIGTMVTLRGVRMYEFLARA
jgi:large subunit ribosomal protein L5